MFRPRLLRDIQHRFACENEHAHATPWRTVLNATGRVMDQPLADGLRSEVRGVADGGEADVETRATATADGCYDQPRSACSIAVAWPSRSNTGGTTAYA